MTKRLLVLAMLSLVLSAKTFSQCVPDTSIHQFGIYPDSLTGLSSGVLGVPYTQVLQVRVPADTVYFGNTVPIDSVLLVSFVGLPPGLSMICNPPSCTFLGGTNGCALISGTPTDTGLYSLTATVAGYAAGFPFPLINQTLTYYSIHIAATVGLQEFSSNAFTVKQNTPNPFSDYSVIDYNIPHKGNVDFKMFNLLGNQVYYFTESANKGANSITVDARKFSAGVYRYSLTFDNKTVTKSLVISAQ